MKTIERSRATKGDAGIPVAAADVPTQADLLKEAGPAVSGSERVSFTTLRKLRVAGFRVDQYGDPPHHMVWLPPGMSDDDAARTFKELFDPSIEVALLLDGNSV